jgi:hypothetical protein
MLTLKCVQVQKGQCVVVQSDVLQFSSLFECVLLDFLKFHFISVKKFQIWEFREDF